MRRPWWPALLVPLTLSPAAADEVIVHARVLHVRDLPEDGADVCARVEAGRRAELLEERDGWVRIAYADGESRIVGWVAKSWVTLFDTRSATPVGRTAVVTGEQVNVRNGPSTRNPAIDFLKRGSEVLVVQVEERWYKVVYGKEEPPAVGWIHVNYVKLPPREELASPPGQ